MRENLVELALAMAVEIDRLARDPRFSEIYIDTTIPRRYRAEVARRIAAFRQEEERTIVINPQHTAAFLTEFRGARK